MYAKGQGVTQDDGEAARLYRLAAEQGYPEAQLLLGLLYSSGKDVPQDLVQAHKWINLAAVAGNPDAVAIASLLDRKMTPAQITEAKKLARAWRPKSA